ncbi:hypothetical protein L1049_021058 [Liquidambar formosana]|uniref:Disease resistance protein RPM1-like n=1 Tax=Liquidambar formosana TaxID=63359 RepID=A0AAP0SES7_LIQFO
MADVAMDLVFGRIMSLLENEVSLLRGVRDEFSEMQLELKSMRAFLTDADRTKALNEGENAWVEAVRDTAYNVEDIIDEFMYHLNRPQVEGKFARFVDRIFRLPKNLWVRHQIATKMRKLLTIIKAMPERHHRYGIDRVEGSSSHDDQLVRKVGQESYLLSDDDVVGIDDSRDLLIGWLTDELQQRVVISVVGMGGSGKTTLVAQAYKSPTIKRHFDCCAWLAVSQTYDIDDLFRKMIKGFFEPIKDLIPSDLSTMSNEQLVKMLVDFLKQRRYILVLDDVWDIYLWREIKVSLPDGRHGSRILLTTRKEDVASFSYGAGCRVHPIRPLGNNEAWVLFCKIAFSRNPTNSCPSETLESIGRELVRKCDGLPLAIVALGGVMSSKQFEFEWNIVRNSLNWELSNNPGLEVVKSILLVSFNDLPYRLKQCFLYCCVFPEDFLIQQKRLIRLWMAEGFVEKISGLIPEEVAERYLMELVGRSMLQVIQRDPFGRPKQFKMHDIMRELALSTSEGEKFCNVYDGREDTIESGVHRLSIQRCVERTNLPADISRLRSFFVFIRDFAPSAPPEFRLLRVLDMEDAQIDQLPDGLENLFNLRYLNLKNTSVNKLPKSIERLRNLQTLNIKRTKVEELPSGIVKLQNLRYLIMWRWIVAADGASHYAFGLRVPSDISKLKNLQVLNYVKAEGDITRQVGNMTQLRSFGIDDVKGADVGDLCTSIQNMKLLHRLYVRLTYSEQVLPMDMLSSPPPDLHKLTLEGGLKNVPRWFRSLHNLTHLTLFLSRLREDPLSHIQDLSNLVELKFLCGAYEGQRLSFRTGFLKLELLQIDRCQQLNEIIIEKGVMPGLQNLQFFQCEALKMLPDGIQHLTRLRNLYLENVSPELVSCIRGEESVDRPKVQHIPTINHFHTTSSGRFLGESLS